MFQLFKKYASVIRFIFTFLGVYLILAFFYNLYLNNFESSTYYPDFLTYIVGVLSEMTISALGYETELSSGFPESTMHLMVNGKFVARIIEGCNSVSIIILFVSFMLAFFGRVKPTLFYILAGSLIIYITNIFRIGVLAVGIYEFPQHAHFLHSIAFPLIIYGTVFLLWVFWIAIYSKQIRT